MFFVLNVDKITLNKDMCGDIDKWCKKLQEFVAIFFMIYSICTHVFFCFFSNLENMILAYYLNKNFLFASNKLE